MRPAGDYRLLHSQPGALALAHAAVDPAVSIATLAAAVMFFGGRFDGACLILALLVFAMTFPGSIARAGSSAGELMLDIVTGWTAIVALLLLLGWASRTLGALRRAPAAAGRAAAPARRRGPAQDGGGGRRQRPRPTPRRAHPRHAAARPALRRLFRRPLRRPDRRDGARPHCLARRLRARQQHRRPLHRAADGVAAAHPQAAGGAARH